MLQFQLIQKRLCGGQNLAPSTNLLFLADDKTNRTQDGHDQPYPHALQAIYALFAYTIIELILGFAQRTKLQATFGCLHR